MLQIHESIEKVLKLGPRKSFWTLSQETGVSNVSTYRIIKVLKWWNHVCVHITKAALFE